MIKTKSGQEIKILKGNKKSITGRQPFLVEPVLSQEQIMKKILNPFEPVYLQKIKLRRDQMIIDNEQELYDALGLTK